MSGTNSMTNRGCKRHLKSPAIDVRVPAHEGDRLGFRDRQILVTATRRELHDAQDDRPFDYRRNRIDQVAAHHNAYARRHGPTWLHRADHLRMHECRNPAVPYTFASEVFTDKFHALPRVSVRVDKDAMRVLVATREIIRVRQITGRRPHSRNSVED